MDVYRPNAYIHHDQELKIKQYMPNQFRLTHSTACEKTGFQN